MFLLLSLINFSFAASHLYTDFLTQCFAFFSIIYLLASFFHKIQNILSHPSLFCFPFNSWYLFLCCFCDCYFELCPFVVPLPQLFLRLRIYLEQPQDTILEGSGWVLPAYLNFKDKFLQWACILIREKGKEVQLGLQ